MRKLFFIIWLLLASAAFPQNKGLFDGQTIYWENDNFGIGRKSDRFYTNGVKVMWLLSNVPEPAKTFRETFCLTGLCGKNQNFESVNIILGHNFYTPENIILAAPQPFDRPWAGWFYTGISESFVDEEEKLLNSFEVHLGILGPGAGAQATQKFIHNDLGFSKRDPQGWSNQIRNEPTINVMYRHARRYGNNTLDVIPEGAVMVGGFQTFASVGATARIGWHMVGFPVGVVVPAAIRLNPDKLPHKYELHFFVAGEARWVPFNATLDGRSGPLAPGPERFVNDVRVGVSGRIGWFRLTYTVIERSKEFDVQPGHLGEQRFGSFALTLEPFDKFRKK